MKKFAFFAAILLCITLFPLPAAKAASDESALFPAPVMNLSQLAYEGYSHGKQNAIDILPGGEVVAPFSGKIVYLDKNWGYVVLQSENKIHWADGSYDYMTVGFMHDENISDLYKGMELTQGEAFYQAGGMGDGNPNAYGDHVHITVHRGHVERGYPYGTGDSFAYDAFFVDPSFTTSTAGRGEGVVASGGSVRNGAPTDYRGLWKEYDSYLVKCEFLPSNERIEIVKKTTIKTLPCSKKTDPDSLDIRNAKLGEEFDTIGLYINSYDNCWYKVLVNGEVGYIYSGDTQWRGSNEPSYTFSGVAAPSSLSRGSRFSIKGELRGRLCEIGLVSGWISERNGATIYHCEENVAGKYYSLLNSDIDMAMLFNELPVGEYTYTVFATLESYFVLDGDLEKQEYGEVLIEKAFSVK